MKWLLQARDIVEKKIIALSVSVIYADNNQQNRCVISRRNLTARLEMVHSTLSIFLVVIYHVGRCCDTEQRSRIAKSTTLDQ